MSRQPSHPDQADGGGRTQANRVSEWDQKIVVPGLIVLFVSCYVTERKTASLSSCCTLLTNVSCVCACVQ